MTYRPISDLWLLARCKYNGGEKRYGGYPGGFLERARALLGVHISDPVLHICGGLTHKYPYRHGFGLADKRVDLDPNVQPDFLQDVMKPLPSGFKAMLADPPYTEPDADHYFPGAAQFPDPSRLMANMLRSLEPGQRAGMLHYVIPRLPKDARFIACVSVVCGFGNRGRHYTVFERGE
jgi:hypothetical protein